MDLQAIFDNFRRTVTEHYFDMNGRVGRAQFWYFVLAEIVGAIIIAIVQSVVFLPLVFLASASDDHRRDDGEDEEQRVADGRGAGEADERIPERLE